jgi:hypothetical protein
MSAPEGASAHHKCQNISGDGAAAWQGLVWRQISLIGGINFIN